MIGQMNLLSAVVAASLNPDRPLAIGARVIVDENTVLEPLPDFPLHVDLARLPQNFWDETSGGDLRAEVDGVPCPVDIVVCDTVNKRGSLFVKVPIVGPLEVVAELGTNITGEDGTTSGWTMSDITVVASASRPSSVAVDPLYGSYMFMAGTTNASGYQDVDISEHSAAVDGGGLILHLNGAVTSDYNDADNGRFTVRFYDEDDVEIAGSAVLPPTQNPPPGTSGWTSNPIRARVPSGCRRVRIGLESTKSAGSLTSVLWDIQSVRLVKTLETSILLTWDGEASRPADSDPLGQFAVWSDYQAVMLMAGETTNRKTGVSLGSTGTAPDFSGPMSNAPGSVDFDADGRLYADGLSGTTTFTMGASYTLSDRAQRSPLAFAVAPDSAAANVVAFSIDGGTSPGIYDSQNSWLYASGSPVLDRDYRVNVIYEGSKQRRLYLDGLFRSRQNKINTRGSTYANLVIGGTGSPWRGKLGFAYLRTGRLSDEWLRVENDMFDHDMIYRVQGELPIRKVRFIFIGASITLGAIGDGETIKGMMETAYGFDVECNNEAVSGWTSTDIAANIDDILSRYPANGTETYCLLHMGGNDVTATRPYSTATEGERNTLANNIEAVLSAIENKGFTPILGELSFRNYGGTTISNEENGSLPYNTNIIHPLIAPEWWAGDEPVLAYYNLIKDNYSTYLQGDGIHLTSAGNAAWRQHIVDRLGLYLFSTPPAPLTFKCSVVVPSGKVASDLTGFPVRVNLADLSAGFWSAVASDGANIRVKDDSDVDVPCDVVWIDKSAMKGEVFFKAPSLLAASDNDFKISVTAGDPAVAKSDPNGRYAVWSDYDGVFIFSEMEDRSGNGRDAETAGTVANNAYVPATYSGDMDNAHQGVAWDGTNYYVIDTTWVKKFDGSGTQIGSTFNLADTGTADVNHFGDGTFHDGNLYVVYETYPNSPYDNQHVVVIDPNTMTMITKYDISAQGHEVSSITYDPVNGYFVITDYTVSGQSVLHKYDASFNYLGTIPCSSISNKQGIAYYDNAFWITCAAKELYKMPLDGSSKTLMWSGSLGNYMEGIASKGDGNFLILFDFGLQSYIYRFAPGSAVGEPGWLNLEGSAHALAHGMPTRTQWTMGASTVLLRNNNGRALLSYSPEVTSNNFRATLAVRSSPINWGIWNSTDSWQTTSAVAATIGLRRRLHHTQNGTTDRKLWIDGVLRTTDTGTAQRPGTSGETMGLYIGAEDASATERMFASINYVYLRNGVLSADWLAAEYASWEQAGFYTVSEIP